MSPIPSVTTLSQLTSSVTSTPGSIGQSVSTTSIHLLGTGGLLFAVVAIVSVAGYLYHGRTSTTGARSSSTWASFTNFISGIRHRGTDISKAAAASSDSSRDLEIGPEHVSMIYARFFHPTFWNVVECYPGTTSIPAIYVEDEANQTPASGQTLPGMNSFLDMDEETEEGTDHLKRACEKPGHVRSARDSDIRVPPYDTRLCTNINFSSAIIGTTVRPGMFLSVPGEHEHDPTDDASYESSSSDSDFEFEMDCSPYDGIVIIENRNRPLPPLPLSARRYGMADMSDLAESLKGAIPEDGYGLVATFSRQTGLVNATDFEESVGKMSCLRVSGNYWPTITDCDTGCCDGHAGREAMDTRVSCRPLESFESVDVVDVDFVINERESCDGFRIISNATDTGTTIYEDIHEKVSYDEAYDGCVFEDMDDMVAQYDVDIHDGCDGLRSSESATDTTVAGQEELEATVVNSDIDVHDSCDGLCTNKIAIGTDDDFQEGLYLLNQLLEELRNPDFDCGPRDLSKESDSDFDYSDDNDDDVDTDNEQAARKPGNSAPYAGIEDEVPFLPPTQPLNIFKSRAATSSVCKSHRRSPALEWINEEVQITPVTSSKLLSSYPEEVHSYIRG